MKRIVIHPAAAILLQVAFWAMVIILLVAASAVKGQPLDTGGWRAGSDTSRPCQYYTEWTTGDPSCPSGGCPEPRGGSVWIGGGISQYGQPIVRQRQAQQARPFVCQMLRNGGFAGSGAYVGEVAGSYLVLTAKHIGAISAVRFGNGETAVVVDAFSDKYGYDLVAFSIGPPSVSPVTLGENPQQGDMVVIAGYPNGRYGERFGPVAGYHQPEAGQPWGDMRLGFACNGVGDSGGPVLDRQGRLVGIHWGGDHQTSSVATSTPAIRDFLRRVAVTIQGGRTEPSPVLPGPAIDITVEVPARPTPAPKPEQPDCDDCEVEVAELREELAEYQALSARLVTVVETLTSTTGQLTDGLSLLQAEVDAQDDSLVDLAQRFAGHVSAGGKQPVFEISNADLPALAKRIQEHLDPITFHLINEAGEVRVRVDGTLEEIKAKPGDTVPFWLDPVGP